MRYGKVSEQSFGSSSGGASIMVSSHKQSKCMMRRTVNTQQCNEHIRILSLSRPVTSIIKVV